MYFFFAKNMDTNIGKYIQKNLSGKYNQKLLDHAKEFVTDALKITSARVVLKTTEASNLSFNW